MALSLRKQWMYGLAGLGSLGLVVFGQPGDDAEAVASNAGRTPAPLRRESSQHSTLTPDAAAMLTRLAHRSAAAESAPALFAQHSWYVAPPPPPPPPPVVRTAPPKPTAPPLPFAFLGSYAAQGDAATYFLSRGDRIFDVKVGDQVDADYSLDSSDEVSLVFTYKPLNARQSLPLGGSP